MVHGANAKDAVILGIPDASERARKSAGVVVVRQSQCSRRVEACAGECRGRSLKKEEICVSRVLGDNGIARRAEVCALHGAAAAECVDGAGCFLHVSGVPQRDGGVVAGGEQRGRVFDVHATHFLSVHDVNRQF